jgi:hypothetical protein
MSLHFHSRRKRPVALIISVLSVFLLGNNYCLVSAIAGSHDGHARLACHPDPNAATAKTGSCCHPVGPANSDPASKPAGPTYPCCMLAATPSALQLGKAATCDHVVPTAVLSTATAPRSASSYRRAPEPRSDPPAAPSHALLRSRAPPLS